MRQQITLLYAELTAFWRGRGWVKRRKQRAVTVGADVAVIAVGVAVAVVVVVGVGVVAEIVGVCVCELGIILATK